MPHFELIHRLFPYASPPSNRPYMPSKRHSLPSTFEHCGVVDFLATYDDFEVLKSLKQLPFDQGDFSTVLPRIVQSLERFAPPPLALPKNWLGKATQINATTATNPERASYSHKREEAMGTSETLPGVGMSSGIWTEAFVSAAGGTLPNISAKSSKRAEYMMLPSSDSPSPQTLAARDPAVSRPETNSHRRQLSSIFVRGQRLPFSIAEEDEQETSESCYSTEDATASSNSQHAETDAISAKKSRTQSSSTVSDFAIQPCSVSIMRPPNRAQLIKERMRRILSSRAPGTRVQGQLV